jgi:DNA polymerase-1
MRLLIDGDIILYTIAFVTENIHEENDVKKRVNQFILQIMVNVECNGEYLVFLTGRDNYRKDIFPDYKKSRKDKVKPRWYEMIRKHLIDKWNAIVVDNIEADDALSITQLHYNLLHIPTIIASKDKDLLQIPGKHYRIPTKHTLPFEIVEVTCEEGFKRLMVQSVMGDQTDDIPGIKGIGPIKSEKLLNNVPLYKLFDRIIRKYIEVYGEAGPNLFWMNYELVKLLEVESHNFIVPQFNKIDTTIINKFKEKNEQTNEE